MIHFDAPFDSALLRSVASRAGTTIAARVQLEDGAERVIVVPRVEDEIDLRSRIERKIVEIVRGAALVLVDATLDEGTSTIEVRYRAQLDRREPAAMDVVRSVDLAASHAAVASSVERAALRVLRSGRYVLGPEVAAFEEELAAFCGVRHVVSCASGTDALLLALHALGVGAGDEVIVAALTFYADAEVVTRLGATPRFVDVDPRALTLDPARAASCVGPRTRAIIVTHLYGMTADMTALRALADRHGIALVEDACQALGSRHHGVHAGALGDVGCFSFFPTKNLGGYGDGGALTTNDPTLAALLRKLRNHGAAEKYAHERVGLNSRLDALQAAMLRAKLPHLEAWNRRRAQIARRYDAALRARGRTPAFVPEGCTPNWHQYTIRIARADDAEREDRDAVRARMAERGVETSVHYPRAVMENEPYSSATNPRDFPVAVRAAREVLSLPMHPGLSDAQVDRVVDRMVDRVVEALASG